MEVRDKQIFDLVEGDAFAFEFCCELRESAGPAAINEEFAILDLNCVVIGGLVADVDDVNTFLRHSQHFNLCQPFYPVPASSRRDNSAQWVAVYMI